MDTSVANEAAFKGKAFKFRLALCSWEAGESPLNLGVVFGQAPSIPESSGVPPDQGFMN